TILGALRDAIQTKFTVKTRLGFDSPAVFEQFIRIFARHNLDLLTVHARTVKEMYGPHVRYYYITDAEKDMPCPVVAHGNVHSAQSGAEILETKGAAGLMIGRGAIRNPWLFAQIRQRLGGEDVVIPTGLDVLSYVRELYQAACSPELPEMTQVQKMKKYM